jgi:hypothetical protein
MKWLMGLSALLLIAISGCCGEKEKEKPVPLVDQPRPSSSVGQIIEDMTGKTDVKAGQRAAATIRKVQAQETKDLNEVMQ